MISREGLTSGSCVFHRDLDSGQSTCPLLHFAYILVSPLSMLVLELVLIVTIISLTFITICLHLFVSHIIAWHVLSCLMANIHLEFDAYMSHTLEQIDVRKTDSLGCIGGA